MERSVTDYDTCHMTLTSMNIISLQSIPENIFIVAACNPHRGNSMATHAEETWLHSSYYVRPLHPTLEYLMWDYGCLDCYQEHDYIRTKMQMLHGELPNIEVCSIYMRVCVCA